MRWTAVLLGCFAVLLQTQRQLQHSLEVHQRYIHSLMEQEGLAHKIPEMSAALAKGPASAGGAGGGPPSSVVSEAMPAQPAAGSSMQHQQLGFETGATSARAAAAVVHPSLPRYQEAGAAAAGSNGMHMAALQHQHQQLGADMQQHVGHPGPNRNQGHMVHHHGHHQQQQQQDTNEFLIPGDLMPHARHPSAMGGHVPGSAAAHHAAAAAAGDGSDLLGMGAGGGAHDDLGFLTDHDLHLMLGLPEDLQGPPDKRQRMLGPDDL